MSKSKSTSQKHAELKDLGKKGRDSLFRRLQLTDEILKDHDYVDHNYGSESRAIELFANNEWSEFATRPGLDVLLSIYRAFPERKIWEEYRYDWVAIQDLMKPERGPRASSTNWKSLCQELQVRVKELEAENKVLREQLERFMARAA